jgi:hypothetical protein
MSQYAQQGGNGRNDHQRGQGFGPPGMSKFQKIAAMRAESRAKMLWQQYSLIDPSPTLVDPRTMEMFHRVLSRTDAAPVHQHQADDENGVVSMTLTDRFELAVNEASATANASRGIAKHDDGNNPADGGASVADMVSEIEKTARVCGMGKHQKLPSDRIVSSAKGGYFICRPDQVDSIRKSSGLV